MQDHELLNYDDEIAIVAEKLLTSRRKESFWGAARDGLLEGLDDVRVSLALTYQGEDFSLQVPVDRLFPEVELADFYQFMATEASLQASEVTAQLKRVVKSAELVESGEFAAVAQAVESEIESLTQEDDRGYQEE